MKPWCLECNNLTCSQSCSESQLPVLGPNAAWVCIPSSCPASWKEGHKSILIGSYGNGYSLSSARSSLFFVMLCHTGLQQFQSIFLLLMSSVLFLLFYTQKISLPYLLKTLGASVAIILSTSFSSIQKISCTFTHCSSDCCSFFSMVNSSNFYLILLLPDSSRNSLTSCKFKFPDVPSSCMFFWVGHWHWDSVFSFVEKKIILILFGLQKDQMK